MTEEKSNRMEQNVHWRQQKMLSFGLERYHQNSGLGDRLNKCAPALGTLKTLL